MSCLPVVVMPDHVRGAHREAWLLAQELRTRVPAGWTVVGGQMAQFHAWRTGVTPTRTTTDLDAAISARSHPDHFRLISATLQALGLTPSHHPSGLEHRWSRPTEDGGRLQVDLLLPSNLGEPGPRSANNRPGVQSRGAQWATDMSQDWLLTIGDRQAAVPVPSLMGALVAKASALRNSGDNDPGRHLDDLALLAAIATRDDLLEPVTARQATRVLDALDRLPVETVEVERLRMVMGWAAGLGP